MSCPFQNAIKREVDSIKKQSRCNDEFNGTELCNKDCKNGPTETSEDACEQRDRPLSFLCLGDGEISLPEIFPFVCDNVFLSQCVSVGPFLQSLLQSSVPLNSSLHRDCFLIESTSLVLNSSRNLIH
jgi:hypothetical protein